MRNFPGPIPRQTTNRYETNNDATPGDRSDIDIDEVSLQDIVADELFDYDE